MQTSSIHILKTNIYFPQDKEFVVKNLSRYQFIRKATIDLEDRDKVLRVESEKLSTSQIINIVANYGFVCAELPE